MVEKLVKDGKVAVLYSPRFGAGWSTWSHENAEAMLFDPAVAQAILDGDKAKAKRLANEKWPEEYCGGIDDLEVEWLDQGTRFEIHEYDGSESIRIIASSDGYVA